MDFRRIAAVVLFSMGLIASVAFVSAVSERPLAAASLVVAEGEVCGGTFRATADASLDSSKPDTNFGTDNRLRVAGGEAEQWQTLLAFETGRLPQDGAIHSAWLLLDVADSSYTRDEPFQVLTVTERWSETAVSWNTRPAARESRQFAVASYVDGTLSINITAQVQAWLSDEETVHSLLLRPRADDMDLNFVSREGQSADASGPRLRIICAPVSVPPPLDSVARDARQMAGLAALQRDSSQPVIAGLDDGKLVAAWFDVSAPVTVGRDTAAQARWFLDEYQDLLGTGETEEAFQLDRLEADQHAVFFRQRHNGIPVYGAYATVYFSDGRARFFDANYVTDINTNDTPLLAAGAAEAIALELAGANARVVGQSQLRYLNPHLLGGEDEQTYLTWRISTDVAGFIRTFLIDAVTGALRHEKERVQEGFDLTVSNAKNVAEETGCGILNLTSVQWFNENGPVVGGWSTDGLAAFNSITLVHKHWLEKYGRDSFDDDGDLIEIFVHVGSNWPSAAALGDGCIVLGDGYAKLDVVGHEFTHMVATDEFGGLDGIAPDNQPGALSESFADIFAHYVDNSNWLIGEDILVDNFPFIRHMADPPQRTSSWDTNMDGTPEQTCVHPDRMSTRCLTIFDSGGVHINAGINNKAAFLITDGGTFNGYTIDGIGEAKARRLFYTVLTAGLQSSSSFKNAGNLAWYWATQFEAAGKYGFTEDDICQVMNAYAAVEIFSQGDKDCDGTLDNKDTDDDSDGKPDGSDNCPNVANPSQSDGDQDGVGDACDNDKDGDTIADAMDNCPFTWNPDQENWNSAEDNVGDHCDDTDGDYDMDADDNCLTVQNPGQWDYDDDGIGDRCDSDADGDSIVEYPWATPGDNCAFLPNKDQANDDLDAYGDACDLCPGFPSNDNGDNDGDGMGDPCDDDDDNDGKSDDEDNCPLVPNPDQANFDDNDIGYACDKAEQEKLEKPIHTNIFIPKDLPFQIDLPVCPNCGTAELPIGYEVSILTSLSGDVLARVVDSGGNVVAQGEALANGMLELNFEAAPFSQTGAGGGQQAVMVLNASTARREVAADEVAYTLEIFAQSDPRGDREYELNLAIAQGFAVYAPLLTR